MKKYATEKMTASEVDAIERKLVEVVGSGHPDVADFATRALIRLLAHVRAVGCENDLLSTASFAKPPATA